MKQVVLTWTIYRISTYVSVNAIVLESMTWHLVSPKQPSLLWGQVFKRSNLKSGFWFLWGAQYGREVHVVNAAFTSEGQQPRTETAWTVAGEQNLSPGAAQACVGSLVKRYLREHQWGGCAERNQAANVAAGAEEQGTAGDWVRLPDSAQQWWWHMARLFSTWCHHLWCTRAFRPDWLTVAWWLHLFCSLQVMPSALSFDRNWRWQWPSCRNCGLAEQGLGNQARKQRKRDTVT